MRSLIISTLLITTVSLSQTTPNVNASRLGVNGEFNEQLYKSALQEVKTIKENQLANRSDLDKKWEFVGGMNVGGRVNELYSPSLGSDTIYAGTANGGAFRSIDAGVSWVPIFDSEAFLSVSAIASKPSNDSVLYIGTGDINFSDPSYLGNGIYKSIDYGDTWTNIGLQDMGVVSEISVNPQNDEEIVVACLGSPFEKNMQRGVYKSLDGGQTWQQTLFVSDSSGVVDISRSVQNPDVLFATNFNRMLKFGKREFSGPDSKLFKSTDGGDTWQEVALNLNYVNNGRMGVEIAPSNDNYVYLCVAQNDGNGSLVLRSEDGGQTWTSLIDDSNYPPNLYGSPYLNKSWEYFRIYVNPLNEEHIVYPALDIWSSTNAGLNWEKETEYFRERSSSCFYDVLFDENSEFIVASAHGVFYKDLVDLLPTGYLPITQFYDLSTLKDVSGQYMGAAEDVGLVYGGNQNFFNWRKGNYYPENNGYKVFANDTTDAYWLTDNGLKYKFDNYQFNFSSFLEAGSNQAAYYSLALNNLVLGSDKVLGVNGLPSQNYLIYSNVLSQAPAGANVNESFWHLSEIERSIQAPNKLIVGTSDGQLWKSDDYTNGPSSFQNISFSTSQFPQKYVTDIKFSYTDNQKYYVAYNGYFNTDNSAFLFYTTDDGNSWVDISGNLPQIGINTICVANGTQGDVLFVGTDAGVFITQDAGQTWNYLGVDMPIIAINDIEIDYEAEKLIVGTYGRSMYSYDISFVNMTAPLLNTSNEVNPASFNVYPNPASQELSTNLDREVDFVIVNTMGQTVLDGRLGQNKSIDLQKLESGVYFLKVGQTTKRFVISR